MTPNPPDLRQPAPDDPRHDPRAAPPLRIEIDLPVHEDWLKGAYKKGVEEQE